jgi:hypothetical protein
MRSLFITVLVFSFTSLFAQEEGIQKGDRELNFNGNITFTSYGEGESKFTSTNGFFSISFGKYVSRLVLVGIAPGLSLSKPQDQPTQHDWNVQVFTNVNFLSTGVFIPYGRVTVYKQSFQYDDNTFIQAGGGVKFFFAERAAWDTQLTYGFNLSNPESGSILFLTGISYIF